MADLGDNTKWFEVDASNTASPPDGFPEGMLPSGVNNSGRGGMGALKRFWDRVNAIKTTGGSASTYTLTYDQAAASYYDGEIHSLVVHATNAVNATLNINGLGARQLRLFAGNILAGALIANQVVQVRYNLSATAFDIIPQTGWVRLGMQSPSAAATVDFTGIPAAVNHIDARFELRPSSDGAAIGLRTYDAAGNLDSGATDYAWWTASITTAPAVTPAASTTDGIALSSGVDNGATGCGGSLHAENIQAATYTKFLYDSNYLNNAGIIGIGIKGFGQRIEADRITGLRFYPSAGTFTGAVTLFASS